MGRPLEPTSKLGDNSASSYKNGASVAFYLISKAKLFEHHFDYLKPNTGRRLEPTLLPLHSVVPDKRSESVTNTYAIEVMTKDPLALSPSSSAAQALALMQEHDIHHLPIVAEGDILGIVSDRDLLKLKDKSSLLKGQLSLEWFMSKIIILCDEETPIDHIAKVFCHEKINGILVLNEKRELSGIITHHDLLKWIYNG